MSLFQSFKEKTEEDRINNLSLEFFYQVKGIKEKRIFAIPSSNICQGQFSQKDKGRMN